MKKILYSVMALAALTFSFTSLTSCEDVPAPYEIPGSGDDNPGVAGTLPYTSTSLSDWNAVTVKGAAWSLGSTYAKATGYNGSTYEATEAWLVSPVFNTGAATGAVINFDHVIRYVFNDSDLDNHELYISSDYDGDVQKATWTKLGYKPVASSTNTWDFYAANTIAVPTEYLGKDVVVAFKFVCGTSNSTTWEVKNFSVAEGTGGDQPDTPEQPGAGQPTGDGTQANPYNSVAANQYASSLASGAESDKDIYVKGKVVSVKEQYGTQYGNATFYISDDGTSDNQFYVFRALYLNNEKYTSGATLNPGDEVVVCGRVTNYMGNTPETVQGKAYLVSLKSNGGGTSGGGTTGDASASNGDFENWTNGQPNNWMTTSTAGNATLSQSTDAHSGKYSVKVAGANQNKRLGYKEMTLKAGEYTMTFYAKAATDKASLRPGFVPVVDGKVGSYVYGEYTNDLTSTEWVKVTHTFKIDEDGTYCLVIMNSKTPGGDLLIDDFTLMMGSTVIIK